MKKFLSGLCLVTIPLILVAYPADWFISKNLKSSNNFAFYEYPVWNDIFEGKVNSNVVIYGSSRAWVHFDPQIIADSLHTTAYNLGVDGHTFQMQYLRHQLFLKYNPKPKVIIHSVDILTLTRKKDLYNSDQFLPYMLDQDGLKETLLTYNGFRAVDFELPIIRYYSRELALKETVGQWTQLDANHPVRVRGFQYQDRNWDGTFDSIKAKLNVLTLQLDVPTIQLFDKYLSECKRDSIKVVFVYAPEYIEGQKFESNRKEVISVLTQMAKKHAVPFFDYSLHPISFDKKNFYNALHLNKTGAVLFNNKLVQHLKSSGVDFN